MSERFDITTIKERIALLAIERVQKVMIPKFSDSEVNFIIDCINEATSPAVVLDPGNYMGRVEAMWAVFSVDEGGEGLCSVKIGDTHIPMVATDKRVFDKVLGAARTMVKQTGKVVRVVKFTKREDIEIIRP